MLLSEGWYRDFSVWGILCCLFPVDVYGEKLIQYSLPMVIAATSFTVAETLLSGIFRGLCATLIGLYMIVNSYASRRKKPEKFMEKPS